MSPEQVDQLLEKLERVAQANETMALMLQVLLEDAASGPVTTPQTIMTQNGPVELG